MPGGEDVDEFHGSFAQQRLWFINQQWPGTAVHNLCATCSLSGPLDIDTLKIAFADVVDRHESLRTTFVPADAVLVQRVWRRIHVPLRVIDASLDAEPAAVAQRALADDAARPFDLERGPLLRATVVTLGEAHHLLLIVLHHIVADAESIAIFKRELSLYYEARRHGRTPALPELPVQYADFAVWQRECLKDQSLQSLSTYWKTALGGSPARLDLPTDLARPAVATHEGACESFSLPASLHERVCALAQANDATPFMVLMAAFALVLHRYSGTDDLCLGYPVANRDRPEVEHLVGLFVNTLVARTRLRAGQTFAEFLGALRKTLLDNQAHQDLPFEMIVDALQPARNLGHAPLFQVLMTFVEQEDMQLGEVVGRAHNIALTRRSTAYDLTLTLARRHGEILGELEYNTSLFLPATVQRLACSFQALLETLVEAGVRAPAASLPPLPQAERHTLLQEWNDTVRPAMAEGGVHERFLAQARARPDAPAVRCGAKCVSYGELDRLSGRLASHLQALGVKSGSLVALHIDRSIDLVVGLLAVLRAGAAYLPLDHRGPAARTDSMLQDAGAPFVLTQRSLRPLPAGAQTVVFVDADEPVHEGSPSPAPEAAIHPDTLAYCIYTSGSTGRPKGVMVTHRSLSNVLSHFARHTFAVDTTGVVAVTRLSFDIAALEIFLPLCIGRELHLLDLGTAADAAQLCNALRPLAGPLLLQSTPSLLRLLVDCGVWPEVAGKLRLLCGGEALNAEFAQRLLESGTPVLNVYGPTETTIWSTGWAVAPRHDRRIPIGRPLANTRVYVLDGRLEPVPIGVHGELHIAGDGLARGYLGQPGWTAERFVPDPFAADGSRMYRTGDRARWLSDGRLEFLGRNDHQVKVRGVRIELGEVESALRRIEGIADAVVVARPAGDAPELLTLVAYVAGPPAGMPTDDVLREQLGAHLPPAALPARFVRTPELPLNANGKVDRARLPEVREERPPLRSDFRPPRTPTELVVAALWSSLLPATQIGARDSFFDLGGNSLSLAALQRRLCEHFPQAPSLIDLFAHTTIEAQARWIDQASAASPPPKATVSLQVLDHVVRCAALRAGERVCLVGSNAAAAAVQAASRLGTRFVVYDDQPASRHAARRVAVLEGVEGLVEFASEADLLSAMAGADVLVLAGELPAQAEGSRIGDVIGRSRARVVACPSHLLPHDAAAADIVDGFAILRERALQRVSP